LGKFYDRDGIGETLLHPGITPPAMRTTPITSKVGGRAGYTPTAGNPCSMDILHENELLEEIANQLSMGAENLMEDNKYLLECNLLDLATTNGEQQEYWLLAIKAARMAGVIRQQTAQQQRTGEL
jgi:hypothetical protein